MVVHLTKAQYAVITSLEKQDMPADHIQPATLGTLCAKKLVNVINGIAKKHEDVKWFSSKEGNYKVCVYK